MKGPTAVALTLVVVVAALPAAATTYYVDRSNPLASDGNPGTEALPWLTIQHAADTMVAGDTVYIRTAVYPEMVTPQSSGSAGLPITYAAYPGDSPTLDGTGITVPDYTGLFYLGSVSFIRVTGLRVVNSVQAGILADGASHVTIDHNSTFNTATSGISAWGSTDVVIEGNRIEEACTGPMQECISVGGCDTFTVRDNEVLDCGKEGICAKDGSANGQVYGNRISVTAAVGLYVDASSHYTYAIDVFDNVVHDAATNGIALASEVGGLLENVRVFNNIAYHNQYVGLVISSCCPETSPTHPLHDITVVNNTLYDNGLDNYWGGGITVDDPDIQNVVVRNNICSQNLSFQLVVSPGVPLAELSVDHQLIDGFRGYEGEIYGDAAVVGDPRFASPSTADFHLLADSPAIDHGSPDLAPPFDFDGHPRPQGSGYDIGAFEWSAAIFSDGFESGSTSAWSAVVP